MPSSIRFTIALITALVLSGCLKDEVKKPDFTSSFIKYYGGEFGQEGFEAKPTPDGGFVFVGTYWQEAGGNLSSIIVIKADVQGNETWRYISVAEQGSRHEGKSIQVLNDAYLIAGNFISSGIGQAMYFRLDKSGVPLEAAIKVENLGFDYRVKRVGVGLNQFFLSGTTARKGAKLGQATAGDATDVTDCFIHFVDKNTMQPVTTYIAGSNGTDTSFRAFQAPSGEIYSVLSSTRYPIFNPPNPPEPNDEIFFLRGGLTGNTYGNSFAYSRQNLDNTSTIKTAKDFFFNSADNVMICGETVNGDMYTLNIATVGLSVTVQPVKSFPLGGKTTINSIDRTADGGYILAGTIVGVGNGGSDMLLVKTDGNGNMVWHRTYGGEGNDIGQSASQTADGGYLLSGSLNIGINRMMCVVKANSEGDLK